jgi:chromosome segregation ATPase
VAEGLEQCKVLPTDLAQVNSLEAALQSKISEISVLQAEKDALLAQKSDLNSKLFDVQEVASVRQQQLTQMHQTLKQLKKDTKKLKSENQEVEALKEEVSHLKLDVGFVQREAVEERLKRSQLVEHVELVLASAVDQLQSMRAEINTLQVCIICVFSRMPIVTHKMMHGEREG